MIVKATERSTYLDVSKIDWEPTRFKGVFVRKLYEDPSGRLTTLTKMEPGAVLPLHRHVGVEQSYVIVGTLVDDDGGRVLMSRTASLSPSAFHWARRTASRGEPGSKLLRSGPGIVGLDST